MNRGLGKIGVICVILGLFACCFIIEGIPRLKARPSKNVRTIEDFHAWKKEVIMGKGTFEISGRTYTVMLAPAGRFGASGPSAYLFDPDGQFVDWTPDLGDFPTVKSNFSLMGGVVKNINHEKP